MIKTTAENYCLAALEVHRLIEALNSILLRCDMNRPVKSVASAIISKNIVILRSDMEDGLYRVDKSVTDFIFYRKKDAVSHFHKVFLEGYLPDNHVLPSEVNSELRFNLTLPEYQKQIDQLNKRLETVQRKVQERERDNEIKIYNLLGAMPPSRRFDFIMGACASLVTGQTMTHSLNR